MNILPFLILGLLPFLASADFKVGDQVLARWTNNLYYRGHVKSFPSSREIEILFTDGDKITHLVEDGTAVIADKAPATVHVRQHVLATWSGRWEDKYYIGFIIDESSSVYKVIFDDGDQAWYERQDLRVLPVVDRFQVGARVFVFWPDGYFYRGFVVKATDSEVKVYNDYQNSLWVEKTESTSVVPDEIPEKRYLLAQYVLAAIPGEERYAQGRIMEVGNRENQKPWAKHAYYVEIKGRYSYWEEFYQIRKMPGL